MFASVVMTLLCTAGIGFYVRFLIGLSKDERPSSTVIGPVCDSTPAE